jgi:hypothetical protein
MPGSITLEGLLRTPLQLEGRLTRPWAEFFAALATVPASVEDLARLVAVVTGEADSGEPASLYGTHAERVATPASSVPDGSTWIETDRNELKYQARGANWVYVAGTYERTQAQLAALAATLTANDDGLLVHVTDHDHILKWTNPAWGWGPGDSRNAGQVAFFDVDPGTGWKLLDGTGDDGQPIGAAHPIAILQADGTTRDNTTAANATANVHVRGAAAYNGAVTPAAAPAVAGFTASGAANLSTASAQVIMATPAGATGIAITGHTHTDFGHTHGATGLSTSLAGGDPVATTDALPYIRK